MEIQVSLPEEGMCIWEESAGGGVLTLTWYTYMCPPFGALFAKFGRAIGGFHQRWRNSNYINWVYFRQIIEKKNIEFGQNLVLFFQK